MTPERAKELLPVITAFAEGKPIRARLKDCDNWARVNYPEWINEYDYEVAPQPVEGWGLIRGNDPTTLSCLPTRDDAVSRAWGVKGARVIHWREVINEE